MHPQTARSTSMFRPASMAVVITLMTGCATPELISSGVGSPAPTSRQQPSIVRTAVASDGAADHEGSGAHAETGGSPGSMELSAMTPIYGREPELPRGIPTAPPPTSTPAEPPTESSPPPDATDLTAQEEMLFGLLNSERDAAGGPPLLLDAELATGTKETACAIARGEQPLVSDREHMREVGADQEHLGLTVESEPDVAAQAMHDWWMQSVGDERLNPDYVRYGVGACRDHDHTYYTERFALQPIPQGEWPAGA